MVQLTGRDNYKHFTKPTGIDLVANPDRVLELPIAVKIMMLGMRDGIYTMHPTKCLSHYLDAPKPDYYNARDIINSRHDGATAVAYYAKLFEKLIRETR